MIFHHTFVVVQYYCNHFPNTLSFCRGRERKKRDEKLASKTNVVREDGQREGAKVSKNSRKDHRSKEELPNRTDRGRSSKEDQPGSTDRRKEVISELQQDSNPSSVADKTEREPDSGTSYSKPDSKLIDSAAGGQYNRGVTVSRANPTSPGKRYKNQLQSSVGAKGTGHQLSMTLPSKLNITSSNSQSSDHNNRSPSKRLMSPLKMSTPVFLVASAASSASSDQSNIWQPSVSVPASKFHKIPPSSVFDRLSLSSPGSKRQHQHPNNQPRNSQTQTVRYLQPKSLVLPSPNQLPQHVSNPHGPFKTFPHLGSEM